jgi:hypothetical protein
MRLISWHRNQRREKEPRIAISDAEISADLHYPAAPRQRAGSPTARRPAAR